VVRIPKPIQSQDEVTLIRPELYVKTNRRLNRIHDLRLAMPIIQNACFRTRFNKRPNPYVERLDFS